MAILIMGHTEGVGAGWDIENMSYDGFFHDISPQMTAGTSTGLAFSTNGLAMYAGGDQHPSTIYQYTLTTPWDLSSGVSYSGNSLNVETRLSNGVQGLRFSSDGTKMYGVSKISNPATSVIEWPLSVAWDLSTAGAHASFSVSAQFGQPNALDLSPDGTKMYVGDVVGDEIHGYTLSTPWDVTSASFDGSYDFTPGTNTIDALKFKSDGTEFYLGRTVNIFIFSLSVPWDITSSSYTGNTLQTSPSVHSIGMDISADGKRLIAVDDGRKVYSFS